MMDLLVDMSVRDAAVELGVSPQRVRALVQSGSLHSVKEGRDLRLSRRDVDRLAAFESVLGRPYSARKAWKSLLGGVLPDESLSVLVSRFAGRAERRLFAVHPSQVERLRDDHRVRLSGHAAADDLPVAQEDVLIEGYVSEDDLAQITDDYRLQPAERAASVILRVVPSEVSLPRDVPGYAIAFDLLDSPLPRVRGIGAEMLTAEGSRLDGR